jgi:hypothetical protein
MMDSRHIPHVTTVNLTSSFEQLGSLTTISALRVYLQRHVQTLRPASTEGPGLDMPTRFNLNSAISKALSSQHQPNARTALPTLRMHRLGIVSLVNTVSMISALQWADLYVNVGTERAREVDQARPTKAITAPILQVNMALRLYSVRTLPRLLCTATAALHSLQGEMQTRHSGDGEKLMDGVGKQAESTRSEYAGREQTLD